VAKDVCEILEIKDVSMALTKIPEKWKGTKVIGTLGGKQDMRIINEAGLYKLIMRSNKPVAQKFQEVVCEEILPSLRKKGEYKIQSIIDKNKELENENTRLEEEKNKKDVEIKNLQNKVLIKQKRNVFENKNFIYMVQDEFHKKERIYVIGKAIDLTQRLTTYNKTREHEVIYCRCCNSAQQMNYIEKCVLSKLDKYREVSNRDRFILPENEPISLFTDIIDLFVNCFSDVDSSVDIEKNLTADEIEMQKKEKVKEYIEDNREFIEESRRQYIEDNKEQYHNFKKVYQENNKEKIAEYQQQYRQDNIEYIKHYNKKYYEDNKEDLDELNKIYKDKYAKELKQYNKEYYQENKEAFKKYKKEHYEKNKDIILHESKNYYNENKEDIKEKVKERYKNNKDKILSYQKEKITCECGMEIMRNYYSKHKKSQIHKVSFESKINNVPVKKKFICDCGHEVGISYTKRHLESKLHKIAMKLKLTSEDKII
jgi:prophage antirepressor-like protein